MKIKKSGMGVFVKVLLVVFLFAIVNVGFIIYASYDEISFEGGLTGFSVSETIGNTFVGFGIAQKVVLFAQVFIFAVIIFIVLARGFGHRGVMRELNSQDVNVGHKKYETDLDTLNNILQKKKKVHLSSIASAFKVSKETAMDWCRALESSHLGSIEYPTLGEPYIKI